MDLPGHFERLFLLRLLQQQLRLLTSQYPFPHINILFDILSAVFFSALGVGLLIRAGSSSGGMVIPALMIANYKNWSPGKVMMGINLFIFLLTALVIDFKIVIFAVICQFISTNIIDYIYNCNFQNVRSLSIDWRKR